MALNPRQEKFCQLYHESGNASQSYEEAYGCSPRVARQSAWRLATNAGIKERLDELKGETRELATLSRQEVIEYLVQAIVTPVSDVTEDSTLCEERTIAWRKEGHGEDAEQYEVEKLKMVSKTAAIKELNRMCGFYEPEKVEHDLSDDLGELIRLATGARGE